MCWRSLSRRGRCTRPNPILLRPEWAALLMSASSVIVTVNALLLNRWKPDQIM